MIHIQRTTKAEIQDALPSQVRFSSEQAQGVSPVTVLICTAGFEDRASAIREAMHGIEIEALVILRYPTNAAENACSLERLRTIPAKRVVELAYDRAEFRRTIRTALDQLLPREGAPVVVDLSVMSSYLLYRVFNGLYEHRLSPSVSVFYAEAMDYFPEQSEWERVQQKARKMGDYVRKTNLYEKTGFQSLGVDAIYESDVFPGRNISALPVQVVAVPNFSRTRMREMLAFAENQYNAPVEDTVWVIGQPPNESKNGWRFEAIKELYEPMQTVVPVPTGDYKPIFWYLADLWESLNVERHLVISTLGSKLQHLGTFLFLKMHPDTGLVLSEPRSFVANRYSTGVGPLWWISFGVMAELRQLISSYGILDFRWE